MKKMVTKCRCFGAFLPHRIQLPPEAGGGALLLTTGQNSPGKEPLKPSAVECCWGWQPGDSGCGPTRPPLRDLRQEKVERCWGRCASLALQLWLLPRSESEHSWAGLARGHCRSSQARLDCTQEMPNVDVRTRGLPTTWADTANSCRMQEVTF